MTARVRGVVVSAEEGGASLHRAPGQALGGAGPREDDIQPRHSPAPRALAERLSARAIREGKNLEAVVIEVLDAARTGPHRP